MQLLDILNAPWAIEPGKLREIQSIYAAHLRGPKIDLEAIEARLQRPLANDQQEYALRDGGVAVLPIEGVIAPKANMFTRISGGVSAQMLQKQIESAVADPRVSALVLAIDSPGGSVFGTPELAVAVFELSKIKPIVTVSDATIASAAYWIGSASNAVFISGLTVQVGSIGVVATHNYDPRSAEGVTEITAGKYKRVATDMAPLSEEGRAYMQARVDHIYSVFVDAVAQQRGASVEAVLEHMADGRIFIGQQAIDAGLVDGVSTVDAMVEQLATNPAAFARRRKAVFAVAGQTQGAGAAPKASPPQSPPQTPPGAHHMNRDELAAQHPQLLQTILAEGATAERARIQAVESALIPGHEALIASLKFDGRTTGGDAALAVNAAERSIREKQGAAAAAEAPKPAAQAAAPAVAATAAEQAKSEEQRLAALPLAERCKAQWEASAQIRAEFGSLEAFTALSKAEEQGRVKVLGQRKA